MRKELFVLLCGLILNSACNHSKPKPVSDSIHQQTVTVNGAKDSVINNSKQNYGSEATISSPCVKCLLGVIQNTDKYKSLRTSIPQQNLIYNVNWVTSKNPVEIDSSAKINNGLMIKVQLKDRGSAKMLATYLYNNQNSRFYLLNTQNKYEQEAPIDSSSLKKIRNSCFWGVASEK